MADKPTICFRCTEEFRNRFIGLARTRGFSAQSLLDGWANGWVTAVERGELPTGVPTWEQPGPVPVPAPLEDASPWHEKLDAILESNDGAVVNAVTSMLLVLEKSAGRRRPKEKRKIMTPDEIIAMTDELLRRMNGPREKAG